jgi:NAD(P) transhydrogenase subunit beta
MDQQVTQTLIELAYLAASVCFILGIKRLSHPDTAPGGNRLAAMGMLVAIVATLFSIPTLSPAFIITGLVVGTAIGAWMSIRVKMTGMPEMVALFNGFGGASSALVASAYYVQKVAPHADQYAFGVGSPTESINLVTVLLSVLVGAITFTGSLLANLRLAGRIGGAATVYPGQKAFNGLLVLACLGLIGYVSATPDMTGAFWALVAVASVLGVLGLLPIGGGDMPVMISFLNSLSGVAAMLTGFVISNTMLIVGGSLVGASGLILTNIMCRGMNRTLASVLFAGVGAITTKAKRVSKDAVPHYTAEDASIVLENARSIIITPGYGLAVAQAQHVVRELGDLLQANGASVKYAIHPVAGRMPGHMNVLLAEADVPYDLLFEMDEINDEFERADVCLIIGANDVVNPAARTDPHGALAGMPILNCDKARTVMIVKRSMSPGFAGVDNPLFYESKTMMLFGDGKKVVQDLMSELKAS